MAELIPMKIRELVKARTQYCEWCSEFLFEGIDLHHRKLRKHGGLHAASNLLALHHECHMLIHETQSAWTYGFRVSAYDDPLTVPVLGPGGTYYLLTDDGQRQPITEQETA